MLLAAWLGFTNLRLNRMIRHYRRLGRGSGTDRLDQLLDRVLERTDLESRQVEALREEMEMVRQDMEGHVQRVGIVRYNAFEDTGGDQSFAVAMLDARGNGAIFNGLYHRKDVRIYAKPVRDWKSIYSMSDEEIEAIRKARENQL